MLEEKVKKLKEIDRIIKLLDPSIREASFKILESYITDIKVLEKKEEKTDHKVGLELEKEEFFTKLKHDKPSDNILSIAAYHYSKYGVTPISSDEIKNIASDVGVIIPNRPDMTIKRAQKDGKNLFSVAGRGKYKPTVHGEKYFKDTYKVLKGTMKKNKD